MSYPVTNLCEFVVGDLSTAEKAVLRVLCAFADDNGGSCRPAIETIARYSRASVNTVRRCLDSLERRGAIACDVQRWRANRYQVHVGWLRDRFVSPRHEDCQDGSPAPACSPPRMGATPARVGGEPSHGGSGSHPDPVTHQHSGAPAPSHSGSPPAPKTGAPAVTSSPGASAPHPAVARALATSVVSAALQAPEELPGVHRQRTTEHSRGPQRVAGELPESVRVAHAMTVRAEVPDIGAGELARMFRVPVAAIEAAIAASAAPAMPIAFPSSAGHPGATAIAPGEGDAAGSHAPGRTGEATRASSLAGHRDAVARRVTP